MYKLVITKQEQNPRYDSKSRTYSAGYTQDMQQYISTPYLEVILSDEEYDAVKKAILSVK